MQRTVRRIIVIALMAIAIFIPQSVAFAGAEVSDNGCPPLSKQAADTLKVVASDAWTGIIEPNNVPTANDKAWYQIDNPGKKGR